MVAIVVSSAACMPGNCWGRYRNVAVLDVPYWLAAQYEIGKWAPKMVSARARGVTRVIRHLGPQHLGKTERSAYHRAWRQACALRDQFNSAGDVASAEQLVTAGGSA